MRDGEASSMCKGRGIYNGAVVSSRGGLLGALNFMCIEALGEQLGEGACTMLWGYENGEASVKRVIRGG